MNKTIFLTSPVISVVICTYNRPDLLKLALKSLINQSLAKRKYEIIIIDNGQLRQTEEVVSQFKSQNPYNIICYYKESNIGLSHARNLGIKKSKGIYIAFIDDDAQLPKDWLKIALILFEKIKPSPLAVGGPEAPFVQGKRPGWFKDEYYSPTKRKLGEKSRFLKKGESLNGSNMIIKKAVLKKLAGFDVKIGMQGLYISAHEETQLFERLWRLNNGQGIYIYYSPHLEFRHLIQRFKLKVSYVLKRSFAAGQAWFARYDKVSILRRLFLICLSFGYISYHIFISLLTFFSYRKPQQWLIEKVNKVLFGIGFMLFGLGIVIKQKQN